MKIFAFYSAFSAALYAKAVIYNPKLALNTVILTFSKKVSLSQVSIFSTLVCFCCLGIPSVALFLKKNALLMT